MMPSVSDTDKTSLDGVVVSKTKADRNLTDRLKSFEVAVFQYKDDANEKFLANLEKSLQVLSKVSDLDALGSNTSLLIDLKYLMNVPSTFGSAISLLTKIVTAVPAARGFLRDRLNFIAALTQLLTGASSTNHGKVSKILELLRFIVYGFDITRQDAVLNDLIAKLLGFISGKESPHLGQALSILISLCRQNFVVKKTILALLTEEDRKTLFTRCVQDQKLQVLNDYLDLCLSSTNLTSQTSSNKFAEKLETRLVSLGEAFCAAYNEDDVISLLIITDFLNDLQSLCPEVKAANTGQIIQQVVVTADYSEGSCGEANRVLFSFVRVLIRLACDMVAITDVVTKAVALRLDSKNVDSMSAAQAILLINDVINTLENEKSEISSTSLQNIRLQLDTVVPLLSDVITVVDVSGLSHYHVEYFIETISAVFDALISVAQSDSWTDLISTHVCHPKSILENLKMLSSLRCSAGDQCLGFVAAKFIKLAKLMTSHSSTWLNNLNEIHMDGSLFNILTNCLRTNCHPESTSDIIQALAQFPPQNEILSNSGVDISSTNRLQQKMTISEISFDMTSVSEMLEECQQALTKDASSMEEIVCKTLELNDLKMTSQLRQLEALKASLFAADEQIARQNIRAVQLESELTKYDQLTKLLWKKIDVSQKELSDIKSQFKLFQDETTTYRRKVSTDLDSKRAEMATLEENQQKLIAKVGKYKEQMIALQNTIKDHQTIRDELEEKLKTETKISHDLTVTLTKREEKLRKKERQLEEEMTEREKLEKEVDRLTKEVASLQSLSKRQEQALAKKDKQLQENTEEINEMKKIHEQIFNLSKLRAAK